MCPPAPTALLREPSGSVLSVARRPGDWLLRWDEQGRALTWRWIEPGRAFAGHMLASADGATVYTTEIDLETGAGLIGVRDGATLAKRDEWSSHGIDPHQLLWDATRPGAFIVANGGVPTRPETGRIKHALDRMDSSLVRLDGASGRRLCQWRLSDPRLSLRHLAWNGTRLGVALQAEHDNPADKLSAPVPRHSRKRRAAHRRRARPWTATAAPSPRMATASPSVARAPRAWRCTPRRATATSPPLPRLARWPTCTAASGPAAARKASASGPHRRWPVCRTSGSTITGSRSDRRTQHPAVFSQTRYR
jgi:hypothetical protein